jgi:hypothetical protein
MGLNIGITPNVLCSSGVDPITNLPEGSTAISGQPAQSLNAAPGRKGAVAACTAELTNIDTKMNWTELANTLVY